MQAITNIYYCIARKCSDALEVIEVCPVLFVLALNECQCHAVRFYI